LLSKNVKIKIYKTKILHVVWYGCEIWSLILREERGLRVFENRVLRRIFGSKRDEVTGELRNEALNDLYSLPYVIRFIISMGWAFSTHREMRVAYSILVGKPEGKTPLGRPRRKWRIILRWIFKRWDGTRIGLLWLRTGTGDGQM
jgi:hypothetical protein